MPDRVLTCTAYDTTTGTCNAQAWVEQASPIPRLTPEEGKEIGEAILYSIVLVLIVKLFLKPSTHSRR